MVNSPCRYAVRIEPTSLVSAMMSVPAITALPTRSGTLSSSTPQAILDKMPGVGVDVAAVTHRPQQVEDVGWLKANPTCSNSSSGGCGMADFSVRRDRVVRHHAGGAGVDRRLERRQVVGLPATRASGRR